MHEKTILEQQIELTKLATIIEGQKVLIEELRRLLSEKEKDQQTLALTAISRPTTNIKNTIKHSVIQNLTPLLEHEMKQHVPQLTVEHVRAGAEGYAKFALSHPLRDKITCTDASRKKLAWKNDSGDIVYDMEGTQLSEKFFRIIKDRNFALFRELVIDLGKKWDDAISRQDQDEADAIAELTDKIGSWRKQAYDASNGDDNELRNEFVRYLCIMSCSDTINK